METVAVQHTKIGLLVFSHLLQEFLRPLDLFREIVAVSWTKMMIHFGNYLILHVSSLTSYPVGIKMEIFTLIYLAYSPSVKL